MARNKYQQEMSLHGIPIRMVTSQFPWQPVLSQADKGSPVRMLTYALPELAWFAEQFPRLSLRWLSLIADSRFETQAAALKHAYPRLSIATHGKLHSKIALVSPDRVYLSSGNLASLGQHDTTLECTSKLLHDWYLENVWLPLWLESKEETAQEKEAVPWPFNHSA